ncbi:unknown [Crocosphaera subtropica ATCC 51142]|uniref:Uncharacterized protein n=1 Tax=Crocosphaera subtropica (strain ATCC 51142 / BH68) TaxID=43989 RepID=B1WY27_CROS5|nr:hypothetical protein [Crocosphaera subtropica]ACB52611.1 unknown [Crocosphaera subtropica ATCC 51142]
MLSSSDNGLQNNVPIPPPSRPRQYRAIGLIEGQYQRSQDHQTRGILITKEGSIIDTVVLGKVLSLFKKHIDLDKPHLWVVYPRTRFADNQLQLQIVGVWEPETLHPQRTDVSLSEDYLSSGVPIKSGDFSIRGQVIYASHTKKIVIVKIRQSPRDSSGKPRFFKLKLQGVLPDQAVGCFWDLQVELMDNQLTIKTGTNLGSMSKKKGNFDKKRSSSPFRPQKRSQNSDRPSSPSHNLDRPLPSSSPHFPLPKPIKPVKHKPHQQN